jgi:hypothetical protein
MGYAIESYGSTPLISTFALRSLGEVWLRPLNPPTGGEGGFFYSINLIISVGISRFRIDIRC